MNYKQLLSLSYVKCLVISKNPTFCLHADLTDKLPILHLNICLDQLHFLSLNIYQVLSYAVYVSLISLVKSLNKLSVVVQIVQIK